MVFPVQADLIKLGKGLIRALQPVPRNMKSFQSQLEELQAMFMSAFNFSAESFIKNTRNFYISETPP